MKWTSAAMRSSLSAVLCKEVYTAIYFKLPFMYPTNQRTSYHLFLIILNMLAYSHGLTVACNHNKSWCYTCSYLVEEVTTRRCWYNRDSRWWHSAAGSTIRRDNSGSSGVFPYSYCSASITLQSKPENFIVYQHGYPFAESLQHVGGIQW